jgi:hypothetical protein
VNSVSKSISITSCEDKEKEERKRSTLPVAPARCPIYHRPWLLYSRLQVQKKIKMAFMAIGNIKDKRNRI